MPKPLCQMEFSGPALEGVSISKKEHSPPIQRPRRRPSLHKTFSEFLDCVRNFSVDERRAALKGPEAWMAEPVGPCQELFTVEGKEPLRDIWDRWPEFQGAGLKSIQTQLEESLSDMYNSGLIANAVWSCMLEHSEELESDDVRVGELKQETQDSQPEVLATTNQSTEQGSEKITTNGAKEFDPADEANTDPEIPDELVRESTEEWDWDNERTYGAGHTISDAARILNIRRHTLYKWIKKIPIKLTPARRISISEIKRVMTETKQTEDAQN